MDGKTTPRKPSYLCLLLSLTNNTGHWILSTYPQCGQNLRNLSTINFIVNEKNLPSPTSGGSSSDVAVGGLYGCPCTGGGP